MEKEWPKKLSNIVAWAGNICGITGKSIFVLLGGLGTAITGVVQWIFKDFKVTMIVFSIAVIIVLIVYIVIQRKRYHRELDELNEKISQIESDKISLQNELDERNLWIDKLNKKISQVEADKINLQNELDERNSWIDKLNEKISQIEADKINLESELKERKSQIDELNKRISICKNAFKKKGLTEVTPVDRYWINKDVYDKFKTKLKIKKCVLEAIFVENTEDSKEYDFKFRWSLTITNPTENTEYIASFIYSGAKEGEENPELEIKSDDIGTKKCGETLDIEVVTYDRVERFELVGGLEKGRDVKICITYDFKKYAFDSEEIEIWLIPETLGFADMDEFCILFYGDGKIVNDNITAKLMSYRLDKEYKPEVRKTFRYEEFNDHVFEKKSGGFKAENSITDPMHGYGYLLILPNKFNTMQKGLLPD